MIALYSIAMEIAVWLVLVPLELLRRSTTLAERLGSVVPRVPRSSSGSSGETPILGEPRNSEEPEEPEERILLIHAVSAGEMNAASALVHEMAPRGWTFVLSAGNDDARRTAERIARHHPEVLRVIAWPWDRRRAVRRWLASVRPDAVAVIETEIWPNLFLACRALGIPLIVAGGRIDPSAARWYRRLRFFFGRILAAASAIVAIDEAERAKYLAIGAKEVTVGGSLKADACLITHEAAARRTTVTVVGASTHEGEERIILDAVSALPVDSILVPRHVQRAAAVRRITGARATVIDRMGALSAIYATADIAVIGGTFVAVGGHDLFEPARAGCAIVVGPHVDQIRETVAAMLDADAIRVTTAERLRDTIAALIDSPAERQWLATHARAFAAARSGAARRCAEVIGRYVGRVSTRPGGLKSAPR